MKKLEVEAPVVKIVNFRFLRQGTIVKIPHDPYKDIIAMTTYNGTLVNLATGDTWSNADFKVEVLPSGSKITITQE
jgi:hypothetical protein